MRTLISGFIILLLISCSLLSCQQNQQPSEIHTIFSMDNLVAWCIIPYDNQQRTPQERAEMLNELGFTKMAYDWRNEHLPLLPEEIHTQREYSIELSSVWLWVDQRASDDFLPEHEFIFETLENEEVSTQIWIGMHENFYEDLPDDEKVRHVAEMVKRIYERAQSSGSSVSLYNHQGWLGIPENQVLVIEATGIDDIGIVFNFHHGHAQIDRFEEALDIMMPWLETVNLNGMEKDGAHILDIGKGDYEKAMIETLIESGYSGNIGIIGHTDGEDVRMVLERNLEGLHEILGEIFINNDSLLPFYPVFR